MRWWILGACACACACSQSPQPPVPATATQQSAPPSASLATPSTSSAPASNPAATAIGIRLTPKVSVACGPDYLERHATSLSDLDGDGTLDRPSIVREGASIVVRLHQLPSFREQGSWKIPNGYLEVATPRRAGTKRGDLWLRVGGDKPTLYQLAGGKLVAVKTGYRDARIRVDVDGDGRVDPIGSDGKTVRALLAGDKWLALPVALSSHVHGAPMPNDQQAAVDLDGNGVRELVIERDKSLAIVEVPSLREVWSTKGKPWKPSLVQWGNALVLVVRLDDKLKLFTTDAQHALIADYPDAKSYQDAVAAIGTQLVMTGHPWQFFERANPAKPVAGSVDELVARLDDREARFGPLRVAAKDSPGLVALGGDAGGPLEIVLVDPVTRALRRTIWKSDRPVSRTNFDLNANLVDLDRNGASELLLEEIHRTAFHHGASWNTSRLRIIDGSGKLLWEEPDTRTDEWVHEGGGKGRGQMRQTRFDGTHVRAFDLADGTMPLRVRSVRDEYYLLASTSKLSAIPPCLE